MMQVLTAIAGMVLFFTLGMRALDAVARWISGKK